MEQNKVFNSIIKKYNGFNIENVQKSTNLYFIKKYTIGDTKDWISMQMNSNSSLRRVYNTLKYGIDKNKKYNSNKVKYDKTIEKYTPTTQGDAEKIYFVKEDYLNDQLSVFKNKILSKEQKYLELNEMNYFTFTIPIEEKNMYLVGKIEKINRVRDGFVAKMIGNEIHIAKNDKFGISENLGMIIYENIIYILNKNFFENFFDLDEKFKKETQKHIQDLMKSNHFVGLDKYLEKVQDNKKYTRKISKALDNFREKNIDYSKISEQDFTKRINKIIEHEEGLELNKKGKIEFKDDTDIENITKLITDDYFITILTETFGSSE